MGRSSVARCTGARRRGAWEAGRSTRIHRRRVSGALFLIAMASGGCYRYVAVPPDAIAHDEQVRVNVTPAAAQRLSGELGVYTTEVDGKLASFGGDSLTVAVPIERKYRGVAIDSTVQTLTLANSELVDVRRSELSRSRTALTVAGVLAGFALLVHAVVQLTNPNPGTDTTIPPPPPAGSRTAQGHLLQFRIPLP
jgi:hypothetical protein